MFRPGLIRADVIILSPWLTVCLAAKPICGISLKENLVGDVLEACRQRARRSLRPTTATESETGGRLLNALRFMPIVSYLPNMNGAAVVRSNAH